MNGEEAKPGGSQQRARAGKKKFPCSSRGGRKGLIDIWGEKKGTCLPESAATGRKKAKEGARKDIEVRWKKKTVEQSNLEECEKKAEGLDKNRVLPNLRGDANGEDRRASPKKRKKKEDVALSPLRLGKKPGLLRPVGEEGGKKGGQKSTSRPEYCLSLRR